MIAKRVDRTTNDSFRRLAEYIAGAKDPGEKLDELWIVNSDAGNTSEALDMAIDGIEANQALNTRVKGDKSYHLVVSFRDEKPSPEAIRDIEQEFAKALGFGEHQRVAATHKNTHNFHMHIAFSKIHPKTQRSHSPSHDFRALEKACRAMEKKYGLQIDPGRDDKKEANRKPQAAKDMEAHTWEQSFFSYVQEHKKQLMNAKDKAQSWQDLHDVFAAYDLMLKKRGNGLVIASGDGNQHMKASDLDRSFSKAALEKQFGPYKRAEKAQERPKPAKRYKRRPITRQRGQERLWRRYMAVRRGRDSLSVRAVKTWRDFLLYGVTDDPLAMAIIHAQKKIMETVTLQTPTYRPVPMPNPNRRNRPKPTNKHDKGLE